MTPDREFAIIGRDAKDRPIRGKKDGVEYEASYLNDTFIEWEQVGDQKDLDDLAKFLKKIGGRLRPGVDYPVEPEDTRDPLDSDSS